MERHNLRECVSEWRSGYTRREIKEIQAKVIDSHYLLPKCASKCVCMCVSE